MLLNTSDDKLSEKNYKAKKILLSMPDFKKYLNLDGAAKLTNELFDTYNVRSVCFDCGIDKKARGEELSLETFAALSDRLEGIL